MDLKTEKKLVREKMKRIREDLPQEYLRQAERSIAKDFLGSELYKSSSCIMGYLAFGNEISVDKLLERALSDGKTVVVPRIVSRSEIKAVLLKNFNSLSIGCYGIRTAGENIFIEPEKIDLVLVPGLAFTVDGSRLGLGVRYYDRFLPVTVNVVKVGVTCQKMLCRELPVEPHDFSVEYVIWDGGVTRQLRP